MQYRHRDTVVFRRLFELQVTAGRGPAPKFAALTRARKQDLMALMNLARGPGRPAPSSELREALAACWHAFIGIGLMSGLINILYLTGSFYMLEVYDRVLPSRSVPTLVGLLVIAAVLYVFQGLLDICRGRVLTRIGGSLDERLHERVYDVLIR